MPPIHFYRVCQQGKRKMLQRSHDVMLQNVRNQFGASKSRYQAKYKFNLHLTFQLIRNGIFRCKKWKQNPEPTVTKKKTKIKQQIHNKTNIETKIRS